jgi:hypothetical protein
VASSAGSAACLASSRPTPLTQASRRTIIAIGTRSGTHIGTSAAITPARRLLSCWFDSILAHLNGEDASYCTKDPLADPIVVVVPIMMATAPARH